MTSIINSCEYDDSPSCALVLSRFRTRNHRLGAETGDWQVPVDGIIDDDLYDCPRCKVYEDENNFMFECLLYEEQRARYIPDHCVQSDDFEDSLSFIFNSRDKITLHNAGNYITK